MRLQLSADMLLYPCVYEELFCITCAEAQVAGAFPITSNSGAIQTTNMTSGLLGNVSSRNFKEQFITKILSATSNRDKLEAERKVMMAKAIKRFSVETILDEWEKLWE